MIALKTIPMTVAIEVSEPLGRSIIRASAANSQGLDFGCGPGPCLSVMLEEQGHSLQLYDLYYANNRLLVNTEYDFITATEWLSTYHSQWSSWRGCGAVNEARRVAWDYDQAGDRCRLSICQLAL